MMDIWQNFRSFIELDKIQAGLEQVAIALGVLLVVLLLGRYMPAIIALIFRRFLPERFGIYEDVIHPVQQLIRLVTTIILLTIAFQWLTRDNPFLYQLGRPILEFLVIIGVAWLASRLFHQVFRVYGIELLRNLNWEVDEVILVLETIANVIIGLIAVLAFAQSQRLNLVGLVASLGIGGIAIAFAAQKTLEQLLGTIVLYLDRPFIPGDYIRIPGISKEAEGLFGRVESIGLRSTKVRTAAKGTLYIVPNSSLANLEIENITRGKKVMVLLYFDFHRVLADRDRALVNQVIAASTDSLFGIDPGSTKIQLLDDDAKSTHARVTFFIMGSSENSIQLRKRLLELANEKMSRELQNYGIDFSMQEPSIYVESPITI